MIFCFDIDGTICQTGGLEYDKAKPCNDVIEYINGLYEQDHTINLFTARGTVTGKDWFDITESQMRQWGVKYHSLQFGKPAADYYIDDKGVNINELRAKNFDISQVI